MNTTHNMRALRLSADDHAREVRNAQADYDTIRARRILATTFDSKTATERAELIKLFVATDEDIIAAAAQLRHAEHLRDRANSILEAAKDERRAAELDARNRRTAAYERLAIQRDRLERTGVDQEDDDLIDDTIDQYEAAKQAWNRARAEGVPLPPLEDESDWF
jgi:hypothetical protein